MVAATKVVEETEEVKTTEAPAEVVVIPETTRYARYHAAYEKYRTSEKGKAAQERYRTSEKGKAVAQNFRKRHTKSATTSEASREVPIIEVPAPVEKAKRSRKSAAAVAS